MNENLTGIFTDEELQALLEMISAAPCALLTAQDFEDYRTGKILNEKINRILQPEPETYFTKTNIDNPVNFNNMDYRPFTDEEWRELIFKK